MNNKSMDKINWYFVVMFIELCIALMVLFYCLRQVHLAIMCY